MSITLCCYIFIYLSSPYIDPKIKVLRVPFSTVGRGSNAKSAGGKTPVSKHLINRLNFMVGKNKPLSV